MNGLEITVFHVSVALYCLILIREKGLLVCAGFINYRYIFQISGDDRIGKIKSNKSVMLLFEDEICKGSSALESVTERGLI